MDPQQTPIQPTPSQPDIQTPLTEAGAPQGESRFSVVMVIVTLIALGTAAYFAWQNYQLRQTATTKPSPSENVTSQLTPTPDPTSNWKIYSSDKLGFSLRYPPVGLTVREGIGPDKTVYLESTQFNHPGQQISYYFYAGKFDNPTGVGVDQVMGNSSGSFPGGFKFTKSTLAQYTVYATDKMPSQSGQLCKLFTTNGSKYGLLCLAPYNANLLTGAQGTVDEQNKLKSNLVIFDQILSTFKFTEENTGFPTPPPGWKTHTYSSEGLTIYTPSDWNSKLQQFPETPSTLITFWKTASPNIVPIQLDIKENWDNTGNAQYLPRTYNVAGSIPAAKVDPPKKEEQKQERYQMNVFFEYSGRVYVFQCVHNWEQDYVDTCTKMLETMRFE